MTDATTENKQHKLTPPVLPTHHRRHRKKKNKVGNTNNVIRSRLLNKLGIYDKCHVRVANNKSMEKQAQAGSSSAAAALSNLSPSCACVGTYSEPLKYDNEVNHNNNNNKSVVKPKTKSSFFNRFLGGATHQLQEEQQAESNTDSNNIKSLGEPTNRTIGFEENKGICFDETVVVVPIPMRNDYSARMKKRLWMNRLELLQNVHRNSIEFAAEGYDWHNVTEDDGMYKCSRSGKLIHPVHCRRLILQRASTRSISNSAIGNRLP